PARCIPAAGARGRGRGPRARRHGETPDPARQPARPGPQTQGQGHAPPPPARSRRRGLSAHPRGPAEAQREAARGAARLRCRVVALASEDWAEAWRVHFRPLPVGKRLLIAPPWDRPHANGRVVITIEPGRAFGTGQHASTLGCLERLESLIARAAPLRLIDLGTGSGVLAI